MQEWLRSHGLHEGLRDEEHTRRRYKVFCDIQFGDIVGDNVDVYL